MLKKENFSNKDLTIVISFIFLMTIWGSSFFLLKQGLKVYTPIEVASIRLSSAMFVLIWLAFFHLKKIDKRKLIHIFISGLIAIGIPAYLFAFAQTPILGISSSISGVLNSLTPLMTFLIGISFFNQKSSLGKIFGLIIGFLGSSLLILVNAKGQFNLNSYAFLVIIASISYGLNVNYIKKYLSEVPPLYLTTLTVSMMGTIALIILLNTQAIEKMQQSPENLWAFQEIVILGVLGTAAAQMVFNFMLSFTSALVASSITYFIPIVAVLWGLYDGEVLLVWHYLGMFLILSGILIMNKMK